MTGFPVDQSGDLSLFIESTPPLLTVILAINFAANFDSDIASEPCILRRIELVLLPRLTTRHGALPQACMIAASVGAGTHRISVRAPLPPVQIELNPVTDPASGTAPPRSTEETSWTASRSAAHLAVVAHGG